MITFEYPAYNPTVTLELPDPEMGNTESYDWTMEKNVTMDNRLYTVITKKDDYKIETLTFIGLSYTLMKSAKNFFINQQGKYFKYTDWKLREKICCLSEDFSFRSVETETVKYDDDGNQHKTKEYEISIAIRCWDEATNIAPDNLPQRL